MPDPTVPEAEVAALVRTALDAQRARTARMLSVIRSSGVLATLALGVGLAYGAGQSDWKVLLPILGGYGAGALVLHGAVRVSARASRWAGLGVALLDVPMVFLAQSASLPVSPSPGGVAGFALGIFVLLVLLGALSLDVWQLSLVALSAAVCEVLLQRAAGIRAGASVAAVVVLIARRDRHLRRVDLCEGEGARDVDEDLDVDLADTLERSLVKRALVEELARA